MDALPTLSDASDLLQDTHIEKVIIPKESIKHLIIRQVYMQQDGNLIK